MTANYLPIDIYSKNVPGTIEECAEEILALRKFIHSMVHPDLPEPIEVPYGEEQEDFFCFDNEEEPEQEPEASEEEKPKDKTRGKGHGRGKIPPKVRREQVLLDLSDEEKVCPDCQGAMKEIGKDESEQYHLIPLQLLALHFIRPKYSCPCCQNGVHQKAKPAEPIEKGNASAALLAWILTGKYCDHLPLYRQEKIFARQGGEISRKTMSDWALRCAELLLPIVLLLRQRILLSHVIHIDDTHIMQQTRGGVGKLHKAHLWTMIGDENNRYIVYDYRLARNRAGPGDLLDGFEGVVLADACSVYDSLFSDNQMIEAGCWKHVRDKFKEAEKAGDPTGRARHAVLQIRRLYKVERIAKELTADERLALRQSKSLGILLDFKAWIDKQHMSVLPASPLAKAMNYVFNHWRALTRFLCDGRLAIDNNVSERSFTPIAIGRKNWLFAGSERGGRAAATIFTLIESAKLYGIDPYEYLKDLLERVSTHPQSRIEELLPDRWKALCEQRQPAAQDSVA